MHKTPLLLICLALILSACQVEQISPLAGIDNAIVNDQEKDNMDTPTPTNLSFENISTLATINTSLGQITLELFPKQAPVTVENFIGLATGNKTWIDPKTSQQATGPLYKGLIFHRVIKDFMVQGGDPLGTGMGGPGYSFKDEFDSSLVFDKPGILAMANSGPNTNGSQFFITLAPTPHLNGKHTIFGQVTEGMEILEKIGSVEVGLNDKPVTDVVLESINVTTNNN